MKPLAPGDHAYIYVIGPAADGLFKIGLSYQPSERLLTLRAKEGPLQLVYQHPVAWASARIVEANAHAFLSKRRKRGEWFAVSAPMRF